MKKNILIFLNFYLPGNKAGGPIQAIKNMTDALDNKYNFFIITEDRDFTDISAYNNIKYNFWNEVGNAKVKYLHPKEINLNTYKKIIKDTNFDLLYLQSFWNPKFTLLTLIAFWISKKNKPVLIHPRGELFSGALSKKTFKKKILLMFFKLFGLYKNFNFNVSTKSEKEALIKILKKIKENKIFVSSDFPKQTKVFEPIIKKDNYIKLVYFSRIEPHKNTLELIKQISSLDIPIKFDIYGILEDIVYWEQCKKEIKKTPSNIKINYIGKISHDNVINTLKSYDFFCLFTKGENFCYAIHEALSSGLPVLISDKTPWHKLHEYNAGWEIPIDKPELINKKILEYYHKTYEEKLAMHKGALQYATDVSNDKQILEDNIKMFETILTTET